MRATPPEEHGKLVPDLVELVKLDRGFKLDIRYATSNNFLSTPLYTQARAFLQRPAAEALVRVNHALRPLGFGLIIHDAYRPWYVTKMFWDATPPDKHIFVANPAEGSRHNRGAAVDLTLAGNGLPNSTPQGGQLTYHFTVTNKGPYRATGVMLTDNLPANVTLVSLALWMRRCGATGCKARAIWRASARLGMQHRPGLWGWLDHAIEQAFEIALECGNRRA